ncbi:hypothetical protein CASFOL_038644 [Castilleja foliolosa]|uniref:Transcription repressor n=1 Tax=Castilleja foliolosa TaxID=1961234 RepID=A0ABD3BLJ3_9LAMI
MTSFARGIEKENNNVVLPDRSIVKNFKSLYQDGFHFEKVTTKNKRVESLSDTPEAAKTLPKPQSEILFSGKDSPTVEKIETSGSKVSALDDFIAVLTYSPSPYKEFQRSMRQMVEVRLERGEKVDWDFLEEFLFRYLNMNNEKAHKYIILAFVDLVVGLHENR